MNLPSQPPLAGETGPLSDRPTSLVQVLGAEPFHTDGELLALGFAPDGSLWSVEEPGVLRHWDAVQARHISHHILDDLATLWAFSPGCRWVASGSDEVSLWDVETGELQAVFTSPTWITSLAFSKDGKFLASGHDDGSFRLWETGAARPVAEHHGHTRPVSALAFRPDGKELASAGEEKVIRVWDLASGQCRVTLHGHTDRIPSVVWHPTQPRIYSAGWDTTARCWNADTGEPIILLNSHAQQVHTLAINPAGTRLAAADSANAIHLWDLEKNRTVRVWTDQGAEVRCLAFSADGQRLASGGADHVLRVRDVNQEPGEEQSPDPLVSRTGITTSPDGQRLYSLASGTRLRTWDVASRQAALELEEADTLRAFALSPDGKLLAGSLSVEVPDVRLRYGGTGIPSLYLWDAATGKRLRVLDGQAPPITSLAFSPDGKLLASASFRQGDVWLWNLATAEAALLIPGAVEGCSIESLAFHPRGQFLAVGGIDWMATGGSDGAVALWDYQKRQLLGQFGYGTTALAIHPSGTKLATASLTRSVQVWEVPEGNLLEELKGHTDAVNCVAFSPDGKYLVSGGDDYTLRLWDATDGTLLGTTTLDTQVKTVCFSPDGRHLFTGNGNTSCYQLEVTRLMGDNS